MSLSSNEIKMDTEIYSDIVDEIDQNSQELIDSNGDGYKEPDAECLENVVMPDYKVAYESLIDNIKYLQAQNANVTALMNKVKFNYSKKVDIDKSKELANNSYYGNGTVSESAY